MRWLWDRISDPKVAARFHVVALLVWLIPGTVITLLWLSNSVVWVSWMSLYAIVIGHWSAFQGAHGEERVKDQEES